LRKVIGRDRVINAVVLVAAVLCIVLWVRFAGRFGALAALSIPAAILFLLVRWHASHYGYCCGHCGAEFEISAFTDFISPHTVQSKYLRCPQCGKRSWAEARAKVEM